jgi:hypothetical protein
LPAPEENPFELAVDQSDQREAEFTTARMTRPGDLQVDTGHAFLQARPAHEPQEAPKFEAAVPYDNNQEPISIDKPYPVGSEDQQKSFLAKAEGDSALGR